MKMIECFNRGKQIGRALGHKAKAAWWLHAYVRDVSGRSPHIGRVVGVQYTPSFVAQQAQGDEEVLASTCRAWDRLFPGWHRGEPVLLVFYPHAQKHLSESQFVQWVESSDSLKDAVPGDLHEAYQEIQTSNIIGVPSTGMRKVSRRVYDRYWAAYDGS